jgi:uncharacterized protein
VKFPFVSRRRQKAALRRQERDWQKRRREQTRRHSASLERAYSELSVAKDVIAHHIVAASHPNTVPQSPEKCMEELQQALADAGVDIRIELARLEGEAL